MSIKDPRDLNALNEYLDGELDGVDRHSSELSEVSPETVARHLLVAGIVQQLGSDTQGTIRQQVHQGMTRVNEVIRQERRARIRVGLLGVAAVAAAITVAVTLFWGQPANLKPVIERMEAYLQTDHDRQYSMRAEARGAALNLVEAQTELCVRGNNKFLLSFSGNVFGSQFVVSQGYDGTDYWVVLPDIGFPTPVLVSKTSLASCWGADSASEMQDVGRGVDRLEVGARIFGLLEDLRTHYKISASPVDASAFQASGTQTAILAQRHTQTDPDFPETIEFLLDSASGTIEQIVAKYMELPTLSKRDNPYRTIRYTLKGEFPRADSVYQHDGHHDGSRKVLRLDH